MKLRIKSNAHKFENNTTTLRITAEATAILEEYPGVMDSRDCYEYRLNNILVDYANLLKHSSFSLKGYFTENEVTAMKAAINGGIYDSSISPKSYLTASILDDDIVAMYEVDALVLAGKIEALDIMQCYTIILALTHFWNLGTSTPEQRAMLDSFATVE